MNFILCIVHLLNVLHKISDRDWDHFENTLEQGLDYGVDDEEWEQDEYVSIHKLLSALDNVRGQTFNASHGPYPGVITACASRGGGKSGSLPHTVTPLEITAALHGVEPEDYTVLSGDGKVTIQWNAETGLGDFVSVWDYKRAKWSVGGNTRVCAEIFNHLGYSATPW